jgi:hypothetical protein
MGRYYCGSISGEFTSEQNPDIFEIFGDSYNWYNYYICGCEYNPIYDELFCQDCFKSIQDVIDKHMEEDGTPILKLDIYEHQQEPIGLKYHLTDHHIPHIIETLNNIEEKLGGKQVVNNILGQLNYTIGCSDDKFRWKLDCSDELYDSLISKSNIVLSDIYFLGLQILECLKITKKCDIYAPFY